MLQTARNNERIKTWSSFRNAILSNLLQQTWQLA